MLKGMTRKVRTPILVEEGEGKLLRHEDKRGWFYIEAGGSCAGFPNHFSLHKVKWRVNQPNAPPYGENKG
jgi:hypothetical protein